MEAIDQPPCRQWLGLGPQLLRQRFIGLTRQAISGELAAWGEAPGHGLALVLLLDRFPHQIWRDSAMAFRGDGQALALNPVVRGMDITYRCVQR